MRGIEEGFTGDNESRRQRISRWPRHWWICGRMGLGFEGVVEDEAKAGSWIRTRAARHPRMASACPGDGRRRWQRVACEAEQGGEEEADGWAPARKILFLYFFSFLLGCDTLCLSSYAFCSHTLAFYHCISVHPRKRTHCSFFDIRC